MANDKNITLSQLTETLQKADDRFIDESELSEHVQQAFEDADSSGVFDSSRAAFALAVASWVSGSGITAFPYKYELTVSGVTADSEVRVVLDPASVEIAAECGVCSSCESGTDMVTIYSRSAPASALTGTLYFT